MGDGTRECDGEDVSALDSSAQFNLTFKTVAIPLAVSTDTYAAQWRQVVHFVSVS